MSSKYSSASPTRAPARRHGLMAGSARTCHISYITGGMATYTGGWNPHAPMVSLSHTDGRCHAQERVLCPPPTWSHRCQSPRTAAPHTPVSSLRVRRALLSCSLPGLVVAGEPGGHLKTGAGGGGGGLTSGRSWARGSEVTEE